MSLESQIVDLIKLGESWGMSKTEIESCLQSQLFKDGGSKRKPASASFLSACSVFKWVILCPIILLGMLLFAYATLSATAMLVPEVENYVGKVAQPYVYPVMRALRMTFKPLADKINIAGYYNAECLVSNPFFLDEVENCYPCNQRTDFVELPAEKLERQMRHIDELVPFVIRNYQKPVNFDKLRDLVLSNEHRFKSGGTTTFRSNVPNVYNISDVMHHSSSQLASASKGGSYVVWESNSVPSAQAIRKLFPRPAYVPESAEVSLMKRIYINGPLSGSMEMSISGFANVWYQQAEGTRELTLVPHPDCQKECQEFSIVLTAGDLVAYQDQYWRLVSSPVYKSYQDELSIAFTGSFTY